MDLHKQVKIEHIKLLIALSEFQLKRYQMWLDADKIDNIVITFTADNEYCTITSNTIPIILRNDIRQIIQDCYKETEAYIQDLKSQL